MLPSGLADRQPNKASYRQWGQIGIPPNSHQQQFSPYHSQHTNLNQMTPDGQALHTTLTPNQKRRARRKRKPTLNTHETKRRSIRRQTRQHRSPNIRGSLASHLFEDDEEFGDHITASNKAKNVVRFVFRNTGRLPLHTHLTPSQASTSLDNKNYLLCQEILDTQADIYAIAEHGLNFSKLSPEDQWKERTLGKLPTAHLGHFSWNKNDPWDQQEARQWGGTGIIAMPQVTPHILEKGSDKTKLGRWTTLLLQGKQGHRVRLVTGYRPHKLQSGLNSGEQTVAAQHQRFFRSQGRELEPQEAFIQDLDEAIEGWLQKGE